jgi:hypothetical protein
MRYIDILVPLLIGLLCTIYPGQLVTAKMGNFEKKKALIKKCGIAFIGIAILLFIARYFEADLA